MSKSCTVLVNQICLAQLHWGNRPGAGLHQLRVTISKQPCCCPRCFVVTNGNIIPRFAQRSLLQAYFMLSEYGGASGVEYCMYHTRSCHIPRIRGRHSCGLMEFVIPQCPYTAARPLMHQQPGKRYVHAILHGHWCRQLSNTIRRQAFEKHAALLTW